MKNVALASNTRRSQYLMEGWKTRIEKLEKATGKSSHERRLTLAYCLNNTKIARDYHESIQTPDAGIYKLFALDMVGAVVQNLLAPEIVSMQPMENMVGMVLYLEYQYGTTKGSTEAGTVFADTRNFYGSDALYSSDQVIDEPFTVSTIADIEHLEGQITGYEHIDDGFVKKPGSVGVANAPNVTVDGLTGSSKGFKLQQLPPIHPNSVEITASITVTVETTPTTYNLVFVDDGAGNLNVASGTVSNLAGKINYATGVVIFTGTTAANITAGSGTVNYSYAITYVDNTASSRRIPEVTLKMKQIPMFAKPRRMKAIWSFESQYILNKEYGGADMEDIMNATVSAEIMHEIDSEVMYDLYKGANAGPEVVWSDATPVGVSARDHYDSFKIALDKASAKIYKATRKVRGNYVIGGVNLGTVCSSTIGFTPANVSNVNGPCYFGKMANGMKVYLNPDFDDDVFVVGYKGSNMFDTGFILGMYMPVTTTAMVQLEDMAGRKGWASSYGKAMVNNRMYIRGRITH